MSVQSVYIVFYIRSVVTHVNRHDPLQCGLHNDSTCIDSVWPSDVIWSHYGFR